MIAQHSSKSNEHYTPIPIVEAARSVMGGIDLDPATCPLANQRIRATTIYTIETNGFDRQWGGSVFLNPPGGKIGNKSNAALWWSKLAQEYAAQRVQQAIFIGFTLEILATSQDALFAVGDVPHCVPRHRLAFDKEEDTVDFYGGEPTITRLISGDSPPHSNVIAYLPPANDAAESIRRFDAVFTEFGCVTIPGLWFG